MNRMIAAVSPKTAAARRVCAAVLAGMALAVLHPVRLALAQTDPLQKQSTSKGAMCPLSDEQTQKSIDAFAKIVPTLTQEPRCVNCHGGVDPFAKPTNHGGDTVDRTTDCGTCHSEMPAKRGGAESKWRLANPEHFFKGKDAKTLCEQMRDVFKQGADFIGHLVDDNGNSKFTEVAFLGTRGLNDVGRDLVEHYKDEPPKQITQGGLINFGMDWISAMGGEFKGDTDCGCEPAHYAIRVTYKRTISIMSAHGTTTMGPVDIPIKFHDNGSFEGEKSVNFSGTDSAFVCSGGSSFSITLRVSGTATEEWQNNHMHMQVENISPMAGSANANCPRASVTGPMNGGNQVAMEKDGEGRAGEALLFDTPGYPGVTTVFQAEIVQTTP